MDNTTLVSFLGSRPGFRFSGIPKTPGEHAGGFSKQTMKTPCHAHIMGISFSLYFHRLNLRREHTPGNRNFGSLDRREIVDLAMGEGLRVV